MSVSVTRVQKPVVPGAERRTRTLVVLDSSYQSEGEPLTFAQLGLKKVDYAICLIVNGDEAEESELFVGIAYYTPSTEKIHLINLKTGKEVASTKKMNKVQVEVIAFGR